MTTKILFALNQLTADDIHQIYSGRCGCACGCMGNYTDGKKGSQKLVNMKKFAADWAEDLWHGVDCGGHAYISCDKNSKEEGVNRSYTVYLNEAATARFKKLMAEQKDICVIQKQGDDFEWHITGAAPDCNTAIKYVGRDHVVAETRKIHNGIIVTTEKGETFVLSNTPIVS